MKKTRISVLILLTLTFSMFPLGMINSVFAKTPFVIPDYEAIDWRSGLAGAIAKPDPSSGIMPEYTGLDYYGPGDEGAVGFDWDAGGYLTLRAVSEFVEIWVADDLLFNNAIPGGDPRNDEATNFMITDDMVNYLAAEFDRCYSILTDYFGTPADRDGTGTIFEAMNWNPLYYNWINTTAPQRVILKIFNIVDDNYFDPDTSSYVAGYFSSLYTGDYYNRNMINIDAWRWWQRLGPEGTEWIDSRPDLSVTRPNLYESVTMHEYQHNIHSDVIPGDETYMNEASSLVAEPLCGYELDTGQIEWFLSTPDNSLTEWGDQEGNILADYGASFLWALYLNDHYGADFMGQYVQNGNPGIGGINTLLEPYGVDFYDVFQDWTIANLIHSDKPGGGIYNYESIDLGDIHPIRIQEEEGTYVGWTYGSTYPTITEPWFLYPDGQPLGQFELNPFATDYIRFPDLRGLDLFLFDGDDSTDYPYAWEMVDDPEHPLNGAWWSGPEGELKNVLLAGAVSVPVADPILNVTTYWDIEDYWDFGFVQVSNDGGDTWTSLANEYTTYDYDPHAYYKITNNLPGLTSWTYFYNGEDYTPIEMSFDLSAYAGEDVLIGFRFMSDWGTEYEGWFITDTHVNGDSFELAPVPMEADFLVAVVEAKITPSGNVQAKQVRKMRFKCDATEIGALLALIRSEAKDAILIVSSASEYGTVDYRFKAMSFRFRRRW